MCKQIALSQKEYVFLPGQSSLELLVNFAERSGNIRLSQMLYRLSKNQVIKLKLKENIFFNISSAATISSKTTVTFRCDSFWLIIFVLLESSSPFRSFIPLIAIGHFLKTSVMIIILCSKPE